MAFTDVFFVRDDVINEEIGQDFENIDPFSTYDVFPVHAPS